MSEIFKPENQTVSAPKQEDGFDVKKLGAELKTPTDVVNELEKISGDTAMAPADRADSAHGLVQLLKKQQDEWMALSENAKVLVTIENKCQAGKELTREDLRFLYEVDFNIKDFNFNKHVRLINIREKRDVKKDISMAIGCAEDEVSITDEEALSGKSKYHFGILSLHKYDGGVLGRINMALANSRLNLPEYISDHLNLSSLTSAKGLKFPDRIGGGLNLSRLITAEGLNLPSYIGRELNIKRLVSAEGLILPSYVGGNLRLDSLASVKGIKFPDYVGGYISFINLILAEGLILPDYIGGDLNFKSLTSIDGLILPDNIQGKVIFSVLDENLKEKLRKKYPNHKIV